MLNQERLIGKLQARMNEEVGFRGDIYVADHGQIDKTHARLLLGYESAIGTPSRRELCEYIVKAFNGFVVPDVETARDHVVSGAVSLIVSKMEPVRPETDAADMIPVSATVFLDQQIKDTWELKDRGDKKVLVRTSDEDISAILEQRKDKVSVATHLSFASIGQATINFEEGDTVRFYKDDTEVSGIVMAKTVSGLVTIRTEADTLRIDASSIYDVVEVNAKTKAERDKELYDYFVQVYGPEYARKMVSP